MILIKQTRSQDSDLYEQQISGGGVQACGVRSGPVRGRCGCVQF